MNPNPEPGNETNPAAQSAPAPATNAPASAADAPVEMERLNELTDGDMDSIRELVDMFIKQTTQQLEQMGVAVRANKADDVRRVAHSCAGASATLGMVRFVPMLRELEKQGASGTLTTAARVYEDAAQEFKLIQKFLATQLNPAASPPGAALS
jgi:HPt (histidine-containing phosphotransfer) domain-containing protein